MTRQFVVLNMSLHLQRAVFVDEPADIDIEDDRLGYLLDSPVQSPVRFVARSPRSPTRSPARSHSHSPARSHARSSTRSPVQSSALVLRSSSDVATHCLGLPSYIDHASRSQSQSHGHLSAASKRRREELSADEGNMSTVCRIGLDCI